MAPVKTVGFRLLSGARLVLAAVVLLGACGPLVHAQSRGHSGPPVAKAQAYVHYSLGRLMEVEGYLADALVQYRRADALDPGHCELATAVARVLMALGKLDEAVDTSGGALADCPENLDALAVHAEALIASERAQEAEEALESSVSSGRVSRELAILMGRALLGQGRTDEARAFLEERTLADSLSSDLALQHARVLLVLQSPEEAVAELRRAERLDPDNRVVLGMLGRLLIATDKPSDGVPLLERLVARFDALEPEYLSLTAGYSMLGDLTRAHAMLDTASARLGETTGILRARGTVYYESGDLERALESYERSLLLEPDSASALNFVAYTLAEEDRDLDRALEYASRAVEIDPDNPLIRDTLGWVYFRLSRLPDARRELELAVELGGDAPVILEHLVEVLTALGLESEAAALSRTHEDDSIQEPANDGAGQATPSASGGTE